MSSLFSPYDLKGITLRNRFVRSATFEGAGQPDGEVSPLQIKMYRDLAAGEVGLIVTGVVCVNETGRLFASQNCLGSDGAIPGLSRLTQAVHDEGGKVAAQLFHSGREASSFQGYRGKGPSVTDDPRRPGLVYDAMTHEDILQTVEDYGDAAGRAKEAGFDAVQMHGAHAYIFAQFLSPYTNKREDQWGGSLENRTRLHREVLKAIRKRVGEDYPVFIKLGVRDGFDGGLVLEDGLEAACMLAEAGYDCLEISQGLRGTQPHETEFRMKLKRQEDRGFFCGWAAEVKKRVQVPVVTVGGIRDLGMAEDIVQKGQADLVSMSRPLISEPGLIARWRKGDRSEARCVSCNTCKHDLEALKTISCVLDRKKAD
ncbi:MAG: NADH:flavin oxidoreductase [Deltaproteobacteria bacterium]|nr:NADH:flavin oxidoreductase [Deltaproteobacteria bacterium]